MTFFESVILYNFYFNHLNWNHLRIVQLSILFLFIKCDEGYTGDAMNSTCYYDVSTGFQYSFRLKENTDK